MARVRYFNYRDPDSTFLLNNQYRGILRAGVYLGYNVVPGSGDLDLSIDMDTDPDNTGSMLSKLITHDGVVVEEDANLVDVATVSAGDSTYDRIDYLVCQYTYNAGSPANDVSYLVVEGTPSATPVPPALTDDQIPLAEIHVAANATEVTSDDIFDVNRLNLYSDNSMNIQDILREGVYRGFTISQGTDLNQISLSAGVVLTPQQKRVSFTDQSDAFTLSDTADGTTVRFDAVVLLHKFEDVEVNPPDFLVVEGSAADISSAGNPEVPDLSDIVSAAAAFNPKYTSSDHVTVLGYVRVQGEFGSSFVAEYYHTARLFPESTSFYVRGRNVRPGMESVIGSTYPWEFTGPQGLLDLLELIRGLNTLFWDRPGVEIPTWDIVASTLSDHGPIRQPIKVFCQGDFHFNPTQIVAIPEWCEVEGVGDCRFLQPAADYPFVLVGGVVATGGIVAAGAAQSVPQTNVPAGYERYEFNLEGDVPEISSLPGGISSFGFSGVCRSDANLTGNGIVARVGSTVHVFWFEERDTTVITNSDFTVSAIGAPSAPFVSANDVIIYQRRTGLKNITIQSTEEVSLDETTIGGIHVKAAIESVVDNVVTSNVIASPVNFNCKFGDILINSHGWMTDGANADYYVGGDVSASYWARSGYNTYESITIRPKFEVDSSLGASGGLFYERHATIHRLVYDGRDQVNILPIDIDLNFQDSKIGHMEFRLHEGELTLNIINSFVGALHYGEENVSTTSTLVISGTNTFYGFCAIEDSSTVDFDGSDIYFGYLVNPFGSAPSSNITQFSVGEGTRSQDEDRNRILASNGTYSWDLSTQTLTASDTTVIIRPYQFTNLNVAAFSLTLEDLGVVRVRLGRSEFGYTQNLTATAVTAGTKTLERATDSYYLAWRVGNKVYFRDGTVLEDGLTLSLGTSLPADNTITRDKMTDSSWDYVKTFAHDFFAPSPTEDFPNEVVFLNTGSVAVTYTESTGVVQYASSVDLSNVQPGDTLLARLNPITQDCPSRYRIESVDNANNRVTIATGTGLGSTYPITTSAGSKWGWSIVRGNVVFRNDTLRTLAFDPATAVVSYGGSGSTFFDHVRPGHLFRDGSGNLYKITAVNSTTKEITLEVGVTSIDTTVATEMDGSIETNNNPRELALNDLYVGLGTEEIVFTGDLIPTGIFTKGSHVNTQEYYEFPNDKRVAAIGPGGGASGFTVLVNNTWIDNSWSQGAGSKTRTAQSGISITWVGTGIAFMLDSNTIGSGLTEITLDGHFLDVSTSTGQAGAGFATPPGRLTRQIYGMGFISELPYGIHTVEMPYEADIVGVILLNQPLRDPSVIFESPGRLWAAAKAYDHAYNPNVSLPSVGSRGGSILRYIPDSDRTTKDWAVNSLPEFTTSGQANSTATLSNITDLSGLEVGDLVLLDDGSSPPELHCVESISLPNTLNTVTAVGFSGTCSITYRGRSFGKYVDYAAAARSPFLHDPSLEEQEEVYTAWDLTDVNPPDSNFDAVPHWVSSITVPGGHEFHDEIGFFGGGSAGTLVGGVQGATTGRNDLGLLRFLEDGGDDRIRIGFVGSGLSIMLMTETFELIDPTVDGCVIYSGTYQVGDTGTSDIDYRQSWVDIVSELNYGYHIFEFTADSTERYAAAFRTLKPRVPVVEGTPIFSTSKLCDYAPPRGDASVEETLVDLAEGVIQRSPNSTLRQSGATLTNVVDTTGVVSRGHQYNRRTANSSHYLFFWFWGDRITVAFTPIDATTGSQDVRVLDLDGTFRAPSSSTSWSVNGSDTVTIPASGTGNVYRETWEFDTVGFHCLAINNWNNTSGDGILVAFEESSPTHSSSRFRNAGWLEGYLKTRSSFIDHRNLTPLRDSPGLLGLGYTNTITTSLASSTTAPVALLPFYSRGGFYEVSATLSIEGSVNSSVFTIIPTINPLGREYSTDMASGEEKIVHVSFVGYFPPGRQGIYLMGVVVGSGTVDVNFATYSVKEVARYSDNRYEDISQVARAFSRQTS